MSKQQFGLLNTNRKKSFYSQELGPAKKYISFYLIANLAFVLSLQAFLLGMFFLIKPEKTLLALQENSRQNNQAVSQYEIWDLVNQERSNLNLPILQPNPKLQLAAEKRAQDMMNNNYFNHYSPQGDFFSTWVKKQKYSYSQIGENLAINFHSSHKVVSAWMASEKHRQNILNPYYQEGGLAVIQGDFQGHTATLIVQILGNPLTHHP